jgi:post-segregation antitoxin (ccd killing protein)
MEEASRRLKRAHLVYRERRDALAQFMLSRAAKGAAAASLACHAATEWEEERQAYATVQHVR